MYETLSQWLIKLPELFAEFGGWLTSPLPYLNVSPLVLFGIGGVGALLGFKIFRLVVGG